MKRGFHAPMCAREGVEGPEGALRTTADAAGKRFSAHARVARNVRAVLVNTRTGS
jgi:hypothetical protein